MIETEQVNQYEFSPGPKLAPLRYLRQPQVLARVGVSWITLLRWEKEDRFPKRRRLGPNTVAWVEDEIDQWCESRAVASPLRKS